MIERLKAADIHLVIGGVSLTGGRGSILGTMIGMIESFKLVEVFGDEGGASMLAGSISKALITTAAGLVIAIPTLGVHYWIRHRIHKHAMRLETDLQAFLHALYLKRTPLLEKDR